MSIRSWVYPTVLCASLAAMVAAGGWLALTLDSQLRSLDPPPEPVTVEIAEALVDHSAKATLSGSVHDQPSLLWNSAAGTVTAVHVGQGAVLTSGSPVADVDAVTRRVYWAETVLYRPLARGASGPDVTLAQQLLNDLIPDADIPVNGRFGSDTHSAVRAYERSLGIASPTGVFDPSWFLLLPAESFTVTGVELPVGQPAPAQGTPVATSVHLVKDIGLVAAETVPEGDYVFRYQGAEFPLNHDGEGWEFGDPAAVADLLLQQPSDASLVHLEGRIALARPAPAQAVPPAALVSDAAGTVCLLLADGHRPTSAEIVGTAVDGQALIRTGLPSGTAVLINPLQLVPGATCP